MLIRFCGVGIGHKATRAATRHLESEMREDLELDSPSNGEAMEVDGDEGDEPDEEEGDEPEDEEANDDEEGEGSGDEEDEEDGQDEEDALGFGVL